VTSTLDRQRVVTASACTAFACPFAASKESALGRKQTSNKDWRFRKGATARVYKDLGPLVSEAPTTCLLGGNEKGPDLGSDP